MMSMTNAQAALIAAASMPINMTTDDVRKTAAIFASMLDNVDSQGQIGFASGTGCVTNGPYTTGANPKSQYRRSADE